MDWRCSGVTNEAALAEGCKAASTSAGRKSTERDLPSALLRPPLVVAGSCLAPPLQELEKSKGLLRPLVGSTEASSAGLPGLSDP